MERILVWKRIDNTGLEYARIDVSNLCLEGDIVLVEHEAAYSVSYTIQCDEAAMTRDVLIRSKITGKERELRLARTSRGEWTIDGVRAPHLDGLADIDLSITPSTNTPPIRRLNMQPAAFAEVTAAWVRFPSLDVVPLKQTYRRISRTLYEYEAPDLHFSASLECDDYGIVRVYGGLWKAIWVHFRQC